MAKFFGPSDDFVMTPSLQKGRSPVVRASQSLVGAAAYVPSFSQRFILEKQLPDYMRMRIDVTVAKFMYAMAQCYAEGNSDPLITVEGARLQHGTGNSTRRQFQGKSCLVGSEAAHFGIGTITRQGRALSMHSYEDLQRTALDRGVELRDISSEFAASGRLINFGLAHDAQTFLTPAFYNQTEGLQERHKQEWMKALLPLYVPKTPEALETAMINLGERVIDLLAAQKRVVVRPIDERLLQLRTNPMLSEFIQHPEDLDNLMFTGQEHVALEAMRAQSTDSRSEFNEQVEDLSRRVPARAQDLTSMAEDAKEERS